MLIVSNARSKPLDPSLPPLAAGTIPTTAKMGIDATIPENVPASRYNRIVYVNQGKVDLKNYLGAASDGAKAKVEKKVGESLETVSEKILKALGESHRFYADLLELFPKADYRMIATAVGQLHQEGKIVQDGEGKYQVKDRES